jgi:hypothetical protein
VRYNFIGTACLPFGAVIQCSGLLGAALRKVLASLEDDDDVVEDVGEDLDQFI